MMVALIILKYLALAIIVEAVTEILTESSIFSPLQKLSEKSKAFEVFSCGYCMSVWVALACALACPAGFTDIVWVNVVFTTFLLHRLANTLHSGAAWFLLCSYMFLGESGDHGKTRKD